MMLMNPDTGEVEDVPARHVIPKVPPKVPKVPAFQKSDTFDAFVTPSSDEEPW